MVLLENYSVYSFRILSESWGEKERMWKYFQAGAREKVFLTLWCSKPSPDVGKGKPLHWGGIQWTQSTQAQYALTRVLWDGNRQPAGAASRALGFCPHHIQQFLPLWTQTVPSLSPWECFQRKIMPRRCTVPHAVKEKKLGSLLVGGR